MRKIAELFIAPWYRPASVSSAPSKNRIGAIWKFVRQPPPIVSLLIIVVVAIVGLHRYLDDKTRPDLSIAAAAFVFIIIQAFVAMNPPIRVYREYRYEAFAADETLKQHIESAERIALTRDGWELLQVDREGALYRR